MNYDQLFDIIPEEYILHRTLYTDDEISLLQKVEGKKLYIVYQITNRLNGKYYIGWTVDFKQRWYGHIYSAFVEQECWHFSNALRKYGIEVFEFQILVIVDTEQKARTLENLWIISLGAYNPEVGYNMTFGGETGTPTKEVVEIIRGKKVDWWKQKKEEFEVSGAEYFFGPRSEEYCKEQSRRVTMQWAARSSEERERLFKLNGENSRKAAAARTDEEQKALNKITGEGVRKYAQQHPEWRDSVTKFLRNSMWITNGVKSDRVPKDAPIRDGWWRGRPSKKIEKFAAYEIL